MSDWLKLLAYAVKLSFEFEEKADKCEYDAGYYLARDYEELQEAKKVAIESLAEELQNHIVIKGEVLSAFNPTTTGG